jgi:hypothetical protein
VSVARTTSPTSCLSRLRLDEAVKMCVFELVEALLGLDGWCSGVFVAASAMQLRLIT